MYRRKCPTPLDLSCVRLLADNVLLISWRGINKPMNRIELVLAVNTGCNFVVFSFQGHSRSRQKEVHIKDNVFIL